MANACPSGLDPAFLDLGTVKVAVFGAVQSLTDVFPVSAETHMRILPALVGWPNPGLGFAAAMQAAVLLAVLIWYWRDVYMLIRGTVVAVRDDDYRTPEFRMAVGVLIAAVPSVVAGFVARAFSDGCGASRDLGMIGTAGVVMAVLLGLGEIVRRHRRSFADLRLRDAVFVGLIQAAAVLPGVSRSGAALVGAYFVDLDRRDAVRFSFLVGLPILFLQGVDALLQLRHAGLDRAHWQTLGIGLGVATVVALAAIFLLTRLIERFTAWPLVIWRLVLSGFLLLLFALDIPV